MTAAYYWFKIECRIQHLPLDICGFEHWPTSTRQLTHRTIDPAHHIDPNTVNFMIHRPAKPPRPRLGFPASLNFLGWAICFGVSCHEPPANASFLDTKCSANPVPSILRLSVLPCNEREIRQQCSIKDVSFSDLPPIMSCFVSPRPSIAEHLPCHLAPWVGCFKAVFTMS